MTTTKTELNKVVRIGKTTISKMKQDVFCKIEIANGKLSITGVEGPMPSGNCFGSCGQIDMHKPQICDLAPGWTPEMLTKFWAVWKRWHLNDMKAGSPVQERWLQDNPIPEAEYAYPKSHYEVASAKLSDAGLNPDQDGYKYGHAWNTEELPDDVIDFLASLPDTDKTPAWV